MRARGYTLLEILIVITIIGILAGIGFTEFRSWFLSSQVREASTQVAQDLERVRSSALRTSLPASFTLSADGKSYTLTISGVDRVVPVPNSVTLALDSGNPSKVITYSAPYGEVNVASRTLTFTKSNFSGSRTLYVVGVTGKVIQ